MNFKYIQNAFFLIFLSFSTILFFYVIKDFIFTIFWAIVLSIIFYPLYKKILNKTKKKENLSSLLTILIIFASILIPIGLTASLVAKEAISVAQNISTQNIKNEFIEKKYQEKIDYYLEIFNLDKEKAKNSTINFLKNTLSKVGKNSLDFGKGAIHIIINSFIMLYLIFFFLKDGVKILKRISEILPLGNKIELDIFNRFSVIVKSIFKGTLIVAIVQGSIGALLFFIVGIKAVLLWGLLMILLSVIPAVGPSIILIPTSIFFFLTGDFWQGLVLIIGTIIVSTIDNVLRPILVGHDTKMPDLIITISIFGGLTIFGITGLIIGPVAAGIFIIAWEIFEKKFHNDLKKNG